MNPALRSAGGGLACLALTIAILLSGKAAITGRQSAVTPDLVLETPEMGELDGAEENGATATDGGDDAVPVLPESSTDKTDDPAASSVTSEPLPPPQAPAPAAAKDQQGAEGDGVDTVLRHPVALAAGLVDFEGRQIQLEGLKPQSPERRCKGSSGEWPCGMLARTAFRNFLRARALVCRTPADGWSGTLTTQCLVGGDDPALWLAENGWAEAEPGAPLAAAVETAKSLGKGFYRPVSAPDPRMGGPMPGTVPPSDDPFADTATGQDAAPEIGR